MTMLINKTIDLLSYILSYIFTRRILYYIYIIKRQTISNSYKRAFEIKSKNFRLGADPYITGYKNISIGDNFIAGDRFRMDTIENFNNQNFNPSIIIKNNVNINSDCHIGCIDKIVIGDNVLIASKVLIIDHLHGHINYSNSDIPPINRNLVSKGAIEIESNVWIGENVAILPGVTIGKGSIIGANSVITKNIPQYSVAVGNPVKIIKRLLND